MANKRTNLTDVELFFIRQNPQNLNAQEIADKLDVSVTKVKTVIYEHNAKVRQAEEEKAQAVAETVEQPVDKQLAPPSVIKNLLTRPTEDGRKNISVMVPAASEHLDDAYKFNRGKAKKNNQGHLAPTYPNGKPK